MYFYNITILLDSITVAFYEITLIAILKNGDEKKNTFKPAANANAPGFPIWFQLTSNNSKVILLPTKYEAIWYQSGCLQVLNVDNIWHLYSDQYQIDVNFL